MSLESENLLPCPESPTNSFGNTRRDFSYLDTWNEQTSLTARTKKHIRFQRNIRLQKRISDALEPLEESAVYELLMIHSLTFLLHTPFIGDYTPHDPASLGLFKSFYFFSCATLASFHVSNLSAKSYALSILFLLLRLEMFHDVSLDHYRLTQQDIPPPHHFWKST